MYAVIVFTEKGDVEVVPSCWISTENNICFWPHVHRDDRKRAIIEGKKPNLASDKWRKYDIRILKEFGIYILLNIFSN